jgi:hypothetical protein
MPNHIRKRLRLHQSWTNDIPLKNIWGINFSARTGSGAMSIVGKAIDNYLDIYRPETFQVDQGLFDRVSDSEVGFMLAQNIRLPDEGFGVQNKQLNNAGGFQPIQIGQERSPNNTLSIQFLETNRDVFSFFIQPWIVAASYAGLIETDDPNTDIKCHIDVIQYTRSASRYGDKIGSSNRRDNDEIEYGIRKMHTFYDCVPITSEGDQISYGKMSDSDISNRGAAFNFAHYQLNTPRGVLDAI